MGFLKITHERQDFLKRLLGHMDIRYNPTGRRRDYKVAFLNGILEVKSGAFTAETFAQMCQHYAQKGMITTQQAAAFLSTLERLGFVMKAGLVENRTTHILTAKMYEAIEVTNSEDKIQEPRKEPECSD